MQIPTAATKLRTAFKSVSVRSWVVMAGAAVLMAILLTVFNPGIQKRLVEKYVAPSFEQLSVERIHILPWSLSIRQLDLRVAESRVQAENVDVEFCLACLLIRTVDIDRFALQGGIIDLRSRMPDPSPPEAPFPGIFTLLNQGFSLALGELSVNALVLLNPTDKAHVRVNAADVETNSSGEISFLSTLSIGPKDSLDIRGDIKLDQSSRGRFENLSLFAYVTSNFSTLPAAERTRATINLKPIAGAGDQALEARREQFEINVQQLGPNDEIRAELVGTGLYDPNSGEIRGTHRISSSDKLFAAYAAPLGLPKFRQSADGKFSIDTSRLSGELTTNNRTEFTNIRALLQNSPKAPGVLSLVQDISISFKRDALTLNHMRSRIEGGSNDVVTSTTPSPLTLLLADPSAVLTTKLPMMKIDLAEIPLEWFDALLPEHNIESGLVSGNLSILNDGAGNVLITPSSVITFEDIAVFSDGSPVVEKLNVELNPTITITPGETSIDIPTIAISVNQRSIASLGINVALPTSSEESKLLHATLGGDVDVDGVLTVPGIHAETAGYEIPGGLGVRLDATVTGDADSLNVVSASAKVSRATGTNLLTAKILQAISLTGPVDGQEFELPKGTLARAAVENFDIRWLNKFFAPLAMSGQIANADFNISVESEGGFLLEANQALKVSRLSITDDAIHLVDNVSISAFPTIQTTPTSTKARYQGLRVSSGRQQIINGTGVVDLTHADAAVAVKATGNVVINLANLANQPVISRLLPEFAFDSALSMRMNYDVSQIDDSLEANSLNVDLVFDGRTFAELDVLSNLTVRPSIAQQDNLAQHAIGEVKLSVDDLTPEILGDLLPLQNLNFDAISGNAVLKSDGRYLSARSNNPLLWTNVRLKNASGEALFKPFSVQTSGVVEASGKEINTTLDELTITFSDQSKPALQAHGSATIAPNEIIVLQQLSAKVEGSLVQLLDQPSIIPNHSLTSGKINSKLAVAPNGNIAADTTIDGLESGQALDINTITMPLVGNMRADGRGFDFIMPLIGIGTSGTSNALTVGDYLPQPDQPALLRLKTTSELFFLNDILATVSSIKPQLAKAVDPESKIESVNQTAEIDERPDATAFWNVLPYETHLEFHFGRVFYSDYVAFTDINGDVRINDEQLEIGDFQAHFHDSPLNLDGNLSFDPKTPEPYQADLIGKVENFDLNQFFSELAPTKKSRIEGLFGVDVTIAGNSPNASEFRNKLLIDLNMTSRDGLFRTLPPDSVLMIGASDALGIIGEGLSYVPTGGFGAGAVSRLVNYIAEVEYDSVDIKITRDRSLDLKIERADLLSPEIRIATAGTIEHVSGKDILDSPLDLSANLNMTGKGAAILYSLNLIEDQQDDYGYWKGPEVHISGTGMNTESNFPDIIQRASDATVKGGITRPISGIIGNVKHRWFGNDARLDDAKRDIDETNNSVDEQDEN